MKSRVDAEGGVGGGGRSSGRNRYGAGSRRPRNRSGTPRRAVPIIHFIILAIRIHTTPPLTDAAGTSSTRIDGAKHGRDALGSELAKDCGSNLLGRGCAVHLDNVLNGISVGVRVLVVVDEPAHLRVGVVDGPGVCTTDHQPPM